MMAVFVVFINSGAKLNAMGKRYPHLLQEVEEAKSMLLIPVEDNLLAPRQYRYH